MKLIYNDIDNKDANRFIYPIKNRNHFETHSLDDDDIKYIDYFYKIICDIIDESDKVLLTIDKTLISKFKERLKYKHYDYLDTLKSIYKKDVYIFDISDDNSKKFVKENINFNLYSQDDDTPEIYPEVNRKYVANDKNINFYAEVDFLTENNVTYTLRRFDGLLYCIKKFKDRKYKNIGKIKLDCDKDINQNKKQLFTITSIIESNNILKSYLDNILKEKNCISRVIIKKYNGALLKSHYEYSYNDLYINNQLYSKETFITGNYEDSKEMFNEIYKVVLNDIENHNSNTYYFISYSSSYFSAKKILRLILCIDENSISEIHFK